MRLSKGARAASVRSPRGESFRNLRPTEVRTGRRGIVLVVVTAVVAVLALSAYTMVHWLTLDAEIVSVDRDRVQARLLAESGVALLDALALQRQLGSEIPELFDNAELFAGVAVPAVAGALTDEETEPAGRFSIVSFEAAESGPRTSRDGPQVRFGVSADEGKIDLNVWFARDPTALAQVLLLLPGATEDLVDAVLDWLDTDDQRRPNGAESDDYAQRPPTLRCRNGPIESLDELLAVRGMTPEILFGEDTNRNGWLDPNEDDGPVSPPNDDADGALQRGWADLLTLDSRRRQLDSRLRPRIDLNDPDLGRLYGRVRAELGEELARFAIAFRVLGPINYSPPEPAPVPAAAPDADHAGRFYFRSAADLLDARVDGKWEDKPVVLDSPVHSAAPAGSGLLAKVLDRCTARIEHELAGQIDVTAAPEPVLAILPGLSEAQRAAILAERPEPRWGEPSIGSARSRGGRLFAPGSELAAERKRRLPATETEDESPRTSLDWLLSRQILTRDEFVALEPLMVADSTKLRFQVVGWVGESGPAVRLEVVIDTADTPPRVRAWRMLDRWGAGIDPALLSPQ